MTFRGATLGHSETTQGRRAPPPQAPCSFPSPHLPPSHESYGFLFGHQVLPAVQGVRPLLEKFGIVLLCRLRFQSPPVQQERSPSVSAPPPRAEEESSRSSPEEDRQLSAD